MLQKALSLAWASQMRVHSLCDRESYTKRARGRRAKVRAMAVTGLEDLGRGTHHGTASRDKFHARSKSRTMKQKPRVRLAMTSLEQRGSGTFMRCFMFWRLVSVAANPAVLGGRRWPTRSRTRHQLDDAADAQTRCPGWESKRKKQAESDGRVMGMIHQKNRSLKTGIGGVGRDTTEGAAGMRIASIGGRRSKCCTHHHE